VKMASSPTAHFCRIHNSQSVQLEKHQPGERYDFNTWIAMQEDGAKATGAFYPPREYRWANSPQGLSKAQKSEHACRQ